MMKTSNMLIIFLLIFLHFLCMPNIAWSCNTMNCRRKVSNSLITFLQIKHPFRVIDQQSKSCGSPGFDLYCDNNNLGSLLQLPNAGNFTIDSIHYKSREIELLDSSDCLPRKLLNLNLTTTPFRGITQQKVFRMYNCSGLYHQNHSYDEIGCLRGSNYHVASVTKGESVMNSKCKLLKIVSVPTNNDLYHRLSSYSSIRLTWDEKACDSCGNSESSTMISPTITNSYRMMVTVVSAFVVLILIAILVTVWFRMSSNNNNIGQQTNFTNEQEFANGTTHTSFSTTSDNAPHGLDQVTLATYPMTVIGASGHMIKPDDNKCPICLSDYIPGNTLMILPECLHRFHADCIQSWLIARATCPMCRTSPGIPHNF